MVESCFDDKKVQFTGVNYNSSENQVSPIHRDPSFSRWFDEDGKVHFEHQLENSDAGAEDSDFELPLLHQDKIENGDVDADSYHYKNKFHNISLHLNGSNTMDHEINIHAMDHEVNIHAMDHEINIHNRGKEKENYIPFEIDKGSSGETRPSDSSDNTADSFGNHEKLPLKCRSPVSAADVLKTLFFILVWYTFSTFLTLYNKTLLGDDLGKFPAPLLMNTIHFGMQAILSKFITWFWSNRFQLTVAMTWRDYFMRDGLSLSQLYQQLLEQHWMLT